MPSNVEIKARVPDFEDMKKRAYELSGQEPTVINQEDTFFNVPNGRLKLRKQQGQKGQLIFYKRSDTQGPKLSDYSFHFTNDPFTLQNTLGQALGIQGHVKKVRFLYLVGQTRVHVDSVEGLGEFMELEVVLRDGQTAEEGQRIAYDLMHKLGIQMSDLVSCAYIDLFLNKS